MAKAEMGGAKGCLSKSVRETERIGEALAKTLRGGELIALRGGLGAGKTAFVRGLARGLGLDSDVSSPTFALIHEYHGPGKKLCHADLYRLGDGADLYAAGLYDYLDGEWILAVEWSEYARQTLPEKQITVTLTPTGEDEREILIEGAESR